MIKVKLIMREHERGKDSCRKKGLSYTNHYISNSHFNNKMSGVNINGEPSPIPYEWKCFFFLSFFLVGEQSPILFCLADRIPLSLQQIEYTKPKYTHSTLLLLHPTNLLQKWWGGREGEIIFLFFFSFLSPFLLFFALFYLYPLAYTYFT